MKIVQWRKENDACSISVLTKEGVTEAQISGFLVVDEAGHEMEFLCEEKE